MSPRRAASQADLGKIFGSVTQVLKENRESLNQADDYNHNHGDNMVDTFQVITQAMREKKGSLPAEQLDYAGKKLAQQAQSGSAKLYAQGLSQASERFAGQKAVTPQNAISLLQTLMGSQAGAGGGQSGAADMLGALMGGQSGADPQQGGPGAGQTAADMLGALMGGQAGADPQQASPADLLGSLLGGQNAPAQEQSGMTDLLGSLLSGQTAGAQASAPQQGQPAGGIDLNTLLGAGMAYLQATQSGSTPVQALAQAVVAGSQMSSSTHRQQSGQMVAQTVLSLIGSMVGGKK